jgi:hypothetical protein
MSGIEHYTKKLHAIGKSLLYRFGDRLPDSLYLKLLFYCQTGKRVHLKHPKTFNEKLQWLKLYDHKPEYTTMVDKYAVKEYVSNIIGEEHIIPSLGVWNRPEDITWDELPRQFVLKTTHGGGGKGVIICKDKLTFDKEKAIDNLKMAMRRNLYHRFREWPYKNVPKRIIAEKFMEEHDNPTDDLIDYKFYCFSGEPTYCQVIKDRRKKETIDFFDMEWKHQDFIGLNTNAVYAEVLPKKPTRFDDMKSIAKSLSKAIPFSRIDLYEINGIVYFSEITFYPRSGFGRFSPQRYDQILGDKIILPSPK